MIKVLITDFSRTVLFPKVLTDTHEMNTINRNLIASSLGKDPSEVTIDELKQGAKHYKATDYFVLNKPLLDQFQLLRNKGVESIQIFTSGFVQNHGDLQDQLRIFDRIFNVEENGNYKKTDPKAYENILSTLKFTFPELEASEILFVDDEPGNIDAAKTAGFACHLFPKYNSELSVDDFLTIAAQEFNAFITSSFTDSTGQIK